MTEEVKARQLVIPMTWVQWLISTIVMIATGIYGIQNYYYTRTEGILLEKRIDRVDRKVDDSVVRIDRNISQIMTVLLEQRRCK